MTTWNKLQAALAETKAAFELEDYDRVAAYGPRAQALAKELYRETRQNAILCPPAVDSRHFDAGQG